MCFLLLLLSFSFTFVLLGTQNHKAHVNITAFFGIENFILPNNGTYFMQIEMMKKRSAEKSIKLKWYYSLINDPFLSNQPFFLSFSLKYLFNSLRFAQ